MTTEQSLKSSVGRGLSWSLVNTMIVRIGTFALGIVLARLLAPDQFGVFAIALTVQMVLSTLADLGLGAALVQSKDPQRLAPTVATLGLVWGGLMSAVLALASGPVAEVMGVPSAGPVIALMAVTLLYSGAAVVPYALLLRGFHQRKLLVTGVSDTVITATVAIVLVKMGYGAISLAIARLAAQGVTVFLLYFLAKWKPHFGFNWEDAKPALRFGLPAASALILSMLLVNIDNVVVARIAGETALGFYALAFNVANWPMSTLGQAIKSVSFAAYSESRRRRADDVQAFERDRTLALGVTLAWAAAAPVGLLLATLSLPIVLVLYGEKWAPAAPVLSALAAFGAVRVVFMIIDDYTLAQGKPRTVVLLQIFWIAVLTPAMIVGTHTFGVAGGAWSHVIVAGVVMLPAYLFVAHKVGADIAALVRGALPPVLALVPCALVVYWLSRWVGSPILALLACLPAGLATYAVVLGPWLLRRWREVRHGTTTQTKAKHRR